MHLPCSILASFAALAVVSGAAAPVRTSASFALSAEGAFAGGPRTASASGRVVLDGAVAHVTGQAASAPTPGRTHIAQRSGYAGQLYDLVGLALHATPNPLPELKSTQFVAVLAADDGSAVAPSGGAAPTEWTIVAGPLAQIDATGRAVAAAVPFDQVAEVRARIAGQFVHGWVLVADSIPDNMPGIAGDGIDDAWQFHWFPDGNGGVDAALAAPTADPIGNGVNNLQAFLFNLDPFDPNDRPTLRIRRSSELPGSNDLVFWPIRPGRTYTLLGTTDLVVGPWKPVDLESDPVDVDEYRHYRDQPEEASPRMFYRVQVTRP
jgi:hypothetical protein